MMKAEGKGAELRSRSTEKKKRKKLKLLESENYKEDDAEAQLSGERPFKIRACDQLREENEEETAGLEEDSPWWDSRLILSLHDKSIDLLRKVDLASDYVQSSHVRKIYDQEFQLIKSSRTLDYLTNWVVSTLISSEKQTRLVKSTPGLETSGLYLDLRCWSILYFCLEKSIDLHISLTFSKDFLRVIFCITKDTSSYLDTVNCVRDATLSHDQLDYYETVIKCLTSIFSFNGGVTIGNIDLWIILIDKLLELMFKVVRKQFSGSKIGNFVLQLSCCLLDSFAKFLRVHPMRKNSYRNFIDKLLEPLLQLLYTLSSTFLENNCEWGINLSKLAEDVLTQGLFHPTLIDGFFILPSSVRYETISFATVKEKLVNESYHRHLFVKVDNIVKNSDLAPAGLGRLLHLFVSCVLKHKNSSPGSSRHSDVIFTGHFPETMKQTVLMNESNICQVTSVELRNVIYNFFVQVMEYLIAYINSFIQCEWEEVSIFLNATNILQSINSLLASFMNEKVYLRTGDTSEEPFIKFLRLIYDMVMSFSSKITDLNESYFGLCERALNEVLISVRKELIIAVHHLLNIDYSVAGDDLVGMWAMIFSSLCISYGSIDIPGQSSLFSEIMYLSCRLVNLYSDLRQVISSISALCKALRLSVSLLGNREAGIPSNHSSSHSKALKLLLCSPKFRKSLSKAIRTVPEGQAPECIRFLCSDIVESLEWIKLDDQLTSTSGVLRINQCCDSMDFCGRADILGMALSEVYMVILDSTTVSYGNSYLVGASVKTLTEIVSTRLNSTFPSQTYSIKKFSIVIDGTTSVKNSVSENVPLYYILIFFSRLLLSCRSLFRQTIGFMPPGPSNKISGFMGDAFTMHSGRDWVELSVWAGKGFFSSILQPSAPFIDVIHSAANTVQDSNLFCPQLVYLSSVMATLRLVDLNLWIESSEYVLQWNKTLNMSRLNDETTLSSCHKRMRKWMKRVSEMREEATGLTKFLMHMLKLVAKDLISTSVSRDIENTLIQCLHDNDLNLPLGSINEVSLPCALWWIICKNVDVWSSHATKKDAKNFLSLLIKASITFEDKQISHLSVDNINLLFHSKNVTARQIALEFLSNTISYEQRFVRRYMASRFCDILQESVSSILTCEVDLINSPDWDQVLSTLEDISGAPIDSLPLTRKSMLADESCDDRTYIKLSICQSSLNLLMWMPEDFFRSRSSSSCITCILNLERLLVASLRGLHGPLCKNNVFEFFQLFSACRRVLKKVTVAYFRERRNGRRNPSKLSQHSIPMFWLLKSLLVIIEVQLAFPNDFIIEGNAAIFSVMDHTSIILHAVSRNVFDHAIESLVSVDKVCKEKKALDPSTKNILECDTKINQDGNLFAWESVVEIAELIEENMQSLLLTLVNSKAASLDRKLERLAGLEAQNKISSIMACFQGLIWGLVSALDAVNVDACNFRKNFSKYYPELGSRIDSSVDTCIKFISFSLELLFIEEDSTLNDVLDSREPSSGRSVGVSDASKEANSLEKIIISESKTGHLRKKRQTARPELESFLTQLQNKKYYLKLDLFLELIRGEKADTGFFAKQLFIASSAILKLNLQINLGFISWSCFATIACICQDLLLKFSRCIEMPHEFSFLWLDGAVKFLNELGRYFSYFDFLQSRDLCVKLVVLHIMAIGKCIGLQRKKASLFSQDRGPLVKTLPNSIESNCSREINKIEEFKTGLRMSFSTLIKSSSELHLLSAIQAVERALVGVQDGLVMNYEIIFGNPSGGKVSSNVAAGIDCLDLILEFVTGRRRLNMIKRHVHSLVACLFNIILHLQGPGIFHKCVETIEAHAGPDPGTVILMCIKMLTKIYGKPSLIQVESHHIGESLRVPAPLFQFLLHLQISEAPVEDGFGTRTDNFFVDQNFSVELYSACCRLLCTTLKNYKTETWQFIALLEDSVSVLLRTLEIVCIGEAEIKVSVSWRVHEAVKCASCLRRLYEEIRQQQDVFGQYAFQFLSRYIWVYCGFSPAKKGISREVDESLKPGIYALLDCCSADDLQRLHTLFEEGSCRSHLATLQQDYKLNFQFHGKV